MHAHSLSDSAPGHASMIDKFGPLQRYVVFCLLFGCSLIWVLPIATNDGTVHVGFAHFLSTSAPDDLAAELYARNDGIHPNFIVYALLGGLLRFLSPSGAEGVVQLVCLLGPSIAAYAAIRQIRKDRAWLAVLILPLSLNQTFFLGLYNFCFSTIAFFAAIGAFHWMQKSASPWRLLAPVVALYAAFFCHAAGFIAAVLSIAVLTLVSCIGRLLDGQALARALRSQVRNLAVFASLLPLGIVILVGGSKGPTMYGATLPSRVIDMLRLRLVETHFETDAYIGGLLNLVFIAGVAWIIWKLCQSRMGHGGEVSREAAGMVAVAAAMCLQALLFPDVMGGGWTHFLRMSLFAFLAAPLCLAYLPPRPAIDTALQMIGVACAVVLLSGTLIVQSDVKKELVHFAQIERLIGEHCAVVPIVTEKKPPYRMGMSYDPFFHVATRLETAHDRIALFNFLARLDVYPVRYQPGRDPQSLIFQWLPAQQSPRIEHASVRRFEQASGIAVDYILQWGLPESAQPLLRQPLSILLGTGAEVYRSPDARVRLYKLTPGVRSRCTPP
jgi:hypothetical protein